MAQIELMTADAPVLRRNGGKDGKHTKRKMDALSDAWAEKHKCRRLNGEKISLSEWLKIEE